MVRIDHEKLAEQNRKIFEKSQAYKQSLIDLYEKHKIDLDEEGLAVIVIPTGNAIEYGFGSILPRERCFFDWGKLKRAWGAVESGTGRFPTSLYQCTKCDILYMLTLGEKERKSHRERLNKIVFN